MNNASDVNGASDMNDATNAAGATHGIDANERLAGVSNTNGCRPA
ncbi:hypothetical protein WMF45_04720 [Sorangium sp. So ce448]